MANTAIGVFGNDNNGQPATNNGVPFMLCLILGALQTGLNAIANALGGGTGTQRTLTSTSATTAAASPVALGAVSVSFLTSSDFAGTINGVAFPASASKNIAPVSAADTLPAIPYTISAGTLYIDVLR